MEQKSNAFRMVAKKKEGETMGQRKVRSINERRKIKGVSPRVEPNPSSKIQL